jgi:hypothetical protein
MMDKVKGCAHIGVVCMRDIDKGDVNIARAIDECGEVRQTKQFKMPPPRLSRGGISPVAFHAVAFRRATTMHIRVKF